MANRPLRVLVVLVTLLQMDVLQGTEAQNSTSMAPSVHATWSSSSTVTSSSSVKMAPSPTMQPTSSSVHSLSSSSTVTSSSSVKMAPSPTMQPTSSSVHSLSPSSTVTSSASVEMAFSTIQPSSSASVASLSPSSTVTSSPSVKMASSTIQPSSSASVASLSPSYTVMASSSSEVTASSSMQAPSLPSVLNPSPSSSVPASSSSTVLTTTSPVTTTSPANENMYPYGTAVGDFQDTRYYNDWRCIQFFIGVRGFPFYGKRHYKLHVCRNGLISFLEPWYRYWPYNFGQYWFDRQPLLAPYWSLIDNRDAFREGTSKLYFQIYQKGDDKPSTRNILRKAAEDVNKQCRDHKLPTEFSEASWVMVVTWVNIRHRYSRWWWNLRDLYNTFQAVLITNGVHSFVMYNYPRNGILWSAPDYSWNYDRYWNARSLPVVGINTGDYNRLYYNNPRSGRVNIVDIDDLEGVNIFKSRYSNSFESFSNGVRGRIFIRLEDSQGEDQARLQCINWYYSQNNVNSYLRSLEPCPCTWWQAWRDRRFMWTSWAWPKICFYSTFPSRHGWGQECCYVFFSWGWSSYLALGYPDGGTAHRYHKYYYPSAHNSDDAKAYQQCCVHSNMCWMYYQRRPSDTCSRYIPPRWSWFWGDPHFVTLDNKNYTFNGLGEFVMLDAKDGHFQLQARTKLAKGEGTATVFSGAVAKETDTSTVQVILSDNGTMEVSVDGKPFDITDLTNNSKQLNGSVSVLKPEKNCFEMSFPSGMSVNVCEKLNQLSIVAAAPDSFKNNTKGLLGTWNGDTDDDFTLPNGTVLPGSISSKDIHYKFGLAWQVTNSTTLFTYKPGENMNSFINASFQPMFVDDIKYANQSLKEEAERLCQGDVSCLFDVASTRDLEVGESTKQINSQLVNDSKKMSNEPPKIDNSSSVLYLTVNQNITIHVNATDPDGDDITFNISGIPSEATVTKQPNSITVSWKVTDNKLDIQYIVTDTNEAVSSIKPTIYLCACHHGGSCLKPNITDGSNSTDDKFIRMLCSCSAGYTGSNCESDIDACEANLNPCFPGVKCIDLPAPANMTTGYECGPCPNGYNGTGAECADIDECLSGNHGCSQNCGNTPGSFVCSCNSGYQLNVDRKTCDDVNECLPVSDCMHKCTNTKGSYTCSCNENFKVDPNNKKRCVPKQPCTVVQHGCQHVCYLTEDKQQKCACNQGYKLNDDDKTCSDIDECATNQYRCNQKCHNTKGSYTCSCVNGFELSKDNITCVDINECMRWTFNCSDPSQICENTQGSYKCLCEEGLYLINNKCTAIKPGGTIPPPPTAPTPKEPSKEETANAVNVTVANLKAEEWNKPKEDKFKEVVAGGLTIYCAKHESCHPTVKRAKRSDGFITYTADQVHLLPGFPMQIVSDKYPASSKVARIAFYVNFPPGVVLKTQTALKGEILVNVLNATRADIEKALNVTVLSIKAYKTEQPTEPSVKKDDNTQMYIIIGASVGGGVLVILLVVLIVFCYRKPSGTVGESKIGHQNHGMEMDQTRSDLQSGEHVLLKRVQETNQDDNGNTKKRNSSESSHHSSRVAPVNENM